MKKTKFTPMFGGEKPLSYAVQERKERILVLLTGDKRCRRLAKKLKKCSKGHRCGSVACPVCTWLKRRPYVRTLSRLSTRLGELYHVTLVPDDLICGITELKRIRSKKLERIKNTLRQHMKRHLHQNTIAFGTIEASYDDRLKAISIHFHIIIANNTEEQINKLRSLYTSSLPKLINGMHIKKVRKNPESIRKLISYTQKFTTYYKPKMPNQTNKNKPIRPAPKIERALLLFLDRHKHQHFFFLRGLRRSGFHFNPTVQIED